MRRLDLSSDVRSQDRVCSQRASATWRTANDRFHDCVSPLWVRQQSAKCQTRSLMYVSFGERRRPRDALIATEIAPSLAAALDQRSGSSVHDARQKGLVQPAWRPR